MFIFLCARVLTCMCLRVLGQDMGQDVESYFQEVLAAFEQSTEESGRVRRGTLRSRLQQLYRKIIANSGRVWKGNTVNKSMQASLKHSCSVLGINQRIDLDQ